MRFSRWPQAPLHALLLTLFLVLPAAGPRAQTGMQATAQIPASWNDAVARLASRIGNLASQQKTISMTVRNISSLTEADVAGISQALRAEMARLGFHMNDESSEETRVVVTLSEGDEGYIWVGEVKRGSDEQTEIVSVRKTNEPATADRNAAIVLDRKLVWQQPSQF